MHGVFNAEILSSAASPLLGSPVENIPLQAEHHSGRRAKLFAFPPERCSPSERNAVRIHNGMVFAFRPESRSPSTGFPRGTPYEPDFVVETKKAKLICDISETRDIGTIAVQANAKAASKWCEYATVQERQHGGKPWSYLLIPRDAVKNRLSWAVWRTRFKIASPQNFDEIFGLGLA